MLRRQFQSWLRRRIRGSSRSQIIKFIARIRRLRWAKIRAQLLGLRKYFTRSYWREFIAKRRKLATRKGMRNWLKSKYRGRRKRRWRGWLRGRLRGGAETLSGGLAPSWLSVVSGPLGAALSLVVAEVRRWVEDVLMDRFEALGKRYSALVLRSSALLTGIADRVWYAVSGETPPANSPSVASIVGDHATALQEVGIESADQLATADPDHLANAVDVEPDVIDGWVEQAAQRGTKADRPPLAETVNGKRVQRLRDQVADGMRAAVETQIARVTDAAGVRGETLRERAASIAGRLREEGLPAGISAARTAGREIRASAARGWGQGWLRLRQLSVRVAGYLGNSDGDLRSIEGVGAVYRERLTEAGVTTLTAVAAADPDRLAERIDVSPKRVRRWVTQAGRERSVVAALREQLLVQVVRIEATAGSVRTANPVPLEAVVGERAWGTSEPTADVDLGGLSHTGITSVQQLAAADPTRLAAALDRDVEIVDGWVAAAQMYQDHYMNAPRPETV
jgi:predicted flap endonuclease-1-like 5' DNA nuclease